MDRAEVIRDVRYAAKSWDGPGGVAQSLYRAADMLEADSEAITGDYGDGVARGAAAERACIGAALRDAVQGLTDPRGRSLYIEHVGVFAAIERICGAPQEPAAPAEDALLFSQRQRLAEMADDWARKNGAARCAENVIVALDDAGLINRAAAKAAVRRLMEGR